MKFYFKSGRPNLFLHLMQLQITKLTTEGEKIKTNNIIFKQMIFSHLPRYKNSKYSSYM